LKPIAPCPAPRRVARAVRELGRHIANGARVASVLLELSRRDQHIRQFVEGTARGPPLRLGLGRVLPLDIERGAAEMTIFQRRVERVLVDDRRPRDVDQQRTRLLPFIGDQVVSCGSKPLRAQLRQRRLRALIALEEFGGEPPGAVLGCSMTHSVMRGVLSETIFDLFRGCYAR